MEVQQLEGQELPTGEISVERWKAFLWADATRNGEDAFRYDERAAELGEDGQLVPPTLCQHVAFEATGGIEATLGQVSDDWKSGAALGQLRVEFHAPMHVDEPYAVTGEIANIDRKDGSQGELTIITYAYEVTTTDGEPVYDLEADLILMDT